MIEVKSTRAFAVGVDGARCQRRVFAPHAVDNLVRAFTSSDDVEARLLTARSISVKIAPHTRFTDEERTKILARLEAMKRQIEALESLTREQKRLVVAELQNIGEATKHMERDEWLRHAIGSIVTFMLAGDVQHSMAASLMRWAVSAFHSANNGRRGPSAATLPIQGRQRDYVCLIGGVGWHEVSRG